MTTRQAYTPDICIDALGERPKVTVDCGFKRFIFAVDDSDELQSCLAAAVRYRGMPEYAAACALERWRRVIGTYDDDAFGEPYTEAAPDPARTDNAAHWRPPAREFSAVPWVWWLLVALVAVEVGMAVCFWRVWK